MSGHITVIAGPMRSGKTAAALALLERAQIGGRLTVVAKPRCDTRDADVRSRSGGSAPVDVRADSAAELRGRVLPLLAGRSPLVLIDEAQFLAVDLALEFDLLAAAGAHVVATALTRRADGSPWPGVGDLLAVADEVRALTSVCEGCGSESAIYSRRLSGSTALVEIGDAGYVVLCRSCHAARPDGAGPR